MALNIGNLRDILLRVAYLYDNAPEELKDEYAKVAQIFIEKGRAIIESQQQEEPTTPPPPEPVGGGAGDIQSQVPNIARELWALARGNPDVFQAYARSYPNDELQAIANNPLQLNQLMNQINNTQSEVPGPPIEGIPQAPLKSSNVYGFRYNPLKKELAVRFNQGSVYRYSGVPKQIFDMFAQGDGVAKTSGSNRWGRWWVGKSPSLGAALNNLIKLAGFPYQRIR
jgi:hypothetical protein